MNATKKPRPVDVRGFDVCHEADSFDASNNGLLQIGHVSPQYGTSTSRHELAQWLYGTPIHIDRLNGKIGDDG